MARTARVSRVTSHWSLSKWLGGSVAAASNSLNGIQLGCDPRYIYAPDLINQTKSEWGAGHRNYALGGSTSSRTGRTMLGTGQCALYTGASMQYTPVDACLTQEEGACLSGFSADVEAGTEFGEALVALGMPGSYLTEGNVFLGHYRGRELLNAVRLKSSPEDLKHAGFNLGYAVNLAHLVRRRPSGNNAHTTSSTIGGASILTSSSMWIDNDYRGIVMILDQAMDLDGVSMFFVMKYGLMNNKIVCVEGWRGRCASDTLAGIYPVTLRKKSMN
ncbi:unnamed protein product [Echinostoma caproni]|uniref:PKS_KS domain-containing protein n=1 Tax=Echinostoma caproni TaxID=27848 RepID=A0A183ASV0_9TREM|nr:unnamed protein product [Echinostoma caproni]